MGKIIDKVYLKTLLIWICFFILQLFTQLVLASPIKTTYSARIYKPDGQPLESINVNFKFTILDPSATCSIYVEDYQAINMSSTQALFFSHSGQEIVLFR